MALKGRRAENLAPYEYPSRPDDPGATEWLDGKNAGKTLAEAPPPDKIRRPPSGFKLDPEAAAERLLLKKLSELGDVAELTAHSSALGALKKQVDGELEFAKLVKEQPQYFPRVSQRPRWFYPWLLFAGAALLLMQLIMVAHVMRPPTLSKEAASEAPERSEVAPERQGRVAVARKGGAR